MAEFRTKAAAAAGVDLDARARSLDGCVNAATAATKARGTQRGLDGALAQARDALAKALASAGEPDVATALAKAMDGPALRQADDEVRAWDDQGVKLQGQLETLAQQGVPDDRPDAEAKSAAAASARTALDAAVDAETVAETHATNAAEALDAADAVLRRSAKVRADREVTERVATVCAGRGPVKLALETWVLAAELERVTDAANVHLHRMTAGRYALRRTGAATHGNRQAGLDLEVFDAHTGRGRRTATLSGGEQFQASLALALGLADVVSQGGGAASGKVFEALFVDEGFGSLDPDALDDAIAALDQLRASGRMIGVITHVEAMKQGLPVGIEVRRRSDGRGSSLVAAGG